MFGRTAACHQTWGLGAALIVIGVVAAPIGIISRIDDTKVKKRLGAGCFPQVFRRCYLGNRDDGS